MLARAVTLVFALALVPSLAAAQEFPPAEEGAKLFEGEPLRVWSFPVGVGGGKGWPAGHMHDNLKFADAFGSLNALQLDAGIAYKSVGISAVYRRGFASAGATWCPAGQSCTSSFDSIGAALMIHASDMARLPTQVKFKIGIGWAQSTGEVKESATGETRRVEGWSLYEIVTLGGKLGDATSRLDLGGYALFHFMSFEKYNDLASVGKPAQDKNPNTPILFELGVRLGFD